MNGKEVARDAWENVEKRLGRSVISSERAILNEPGDFGTSEEI